MAESRRRVATELFSGSSHQSLQNPEFRTAGNDMYTYNFNFSPSGETSAATTPGVGQMWGRMLRQVSEYFQSPENRGALRLPAPETSAASSGAIGVQYSMEGAISQQNPQQNDEIAEERSQEDHDVSEMSNVDMREITSQSTLSNAEIYTRSMLSSNAGLPCWDPEPRSPVGERGIVPGDVGTFDLIDGFTKIFNIWEDESLALQLPPNECITRPSRFREGRTVVDGILAEVQRSEDGNYIKSYRFHCKAQQGAVLACTTSADLEQLVEVAALRDFLIQHAGAVYQHANAIRRVADDESLYVVSGCIKSDSWALAAYQTSTEPSGEVLKLSRRNVRNHQATRAPTYDWLSWMGEARFGSNSEKVGERYQGKDQSLFLRGFKLAFSRECRTRLNATLRAKCNDGGRFSKVTPSGAGFLAANEETGHGGKPSVPPGANGKSGMGNLDSLASTSLMGYGVGSLAGGMQVNRFPEISRPNFHPSDCITRILMELTGSDCALCHDDDWRHNPKFSTAWSDISCVDAIASKTIFVLNGVVHLVPRAEDPFPQVQLSFSPISTASSPEGDHLPTHNPSAAPENPVRAYAALKWESSDRPSTPKIGSIVLASTPKKGNFARPETSNMGNLAPPESPLAPVKVELYPEMSPTTLFNRFRSTTPPSEKAHNISLSDGEGHISPRLSYSADEDELFFKPLKRVSSVPSKVKTTFGAYYALSACFALAHYQAEKAKDCRRDEEIWRNEALVRDIEGVKRSGSVATSVKDGGSSVGTESDLFTEEVFSTTGSTAPPLPGVSSPQIPSFSPQLLQSLILSNQSDGCSESGDVDLEHLAKEDPLATQVWKTALARTSSRGAVLTRTLSHEDVMEVTEDDDDGEEVEEVNEEEDLGTGKHAPPATAVAAAAAAVADHERKVAEAPQTRAKFKFGSASDDGSAAAAKSIGSGTEISSRAPGSVVIANHMVDPSSTVRQGAVNQVDRKGKGREVDLQLVQQQLAELESRKVVDKQRQRKEAEAVARARAHESLGAPLLPQQGKRTILLTSESDYTDTDEESWESEDVSEEKGTKAESSKAPPAQATTRQASHPEVRQTIQPTQQHPPAPQRPQLTRTQSNASARHRHTRREMQHIQQRREAQLRVQKAAQQLQEEEEERKWQKEMFTKRPTASFQNLANARTESYSLLTQLMNPDPSIFPPNHPYRRGHSSGEIQRLGGLTMTSGQPGPHPGEQPPVQQVQRRQEAPPQQPQVCEHSPAPPPPPQQQQPQQRRPRAPPPAGLVREPGPQQQQQRQPRAPPPTRLAQEPGPPQQQQQPTQRPGQNSTVPPSPVRSERRQLPTTNPVAALALRGMRGMGLPFSKTATAGPVTSQVVVGSVKPKAAAAPPGMASNHVRTLSGSGGQRQKGPLPGQEMDTDSEDEAEENNVQNHVRTLSGSGGQRQKGPLPGQEMDNSEDEAEENSVQLCRSVAQHRLQVFAARRETVQATNPLPSQQETDEVPTWEQQQQVQADPSRQQPQQPPGPIPMMHPYNLPINAMPLTPRTTRLQMLRNEMPESLRRQLLWERQQAGVPIRRTTSTGGGAGRGNVLGGLRPLTTTPSMVQLRPQGSTNQDQLKGSGDRERRASCGKEAGDDLPEKRRKAMARNKSWADTYHTSGW